MWEELHHRVVVEGGCVRPVDDDIGTRQRFREAFAGNGVDA
jgi:hypothetical protein